MDQEAEEVLGKRRSADMRAELAKHRNYSPHLDNAYVHLAIVIQDLKSSLFERLGRAGHHVVHGRTCDCLHNTAVTILTQLADQRVNVNARFTSRALCNSISSYSLSVEGEHISYPVSVAAEQKPEALSNDVLKLKKGRIHLSCIRRGNKTEDCADRATVDRGVRRLGLDHVAGRNLGWKQWEMTESPIFMLPRT
ncbi:unnamed protein product [Cercospora beticola]|nr:unnamed protein product [Cercospora beticola]